MPDFDVTSLQREFSSNSGAGRLHFFQRDERERLRHERIAAEEQSTEEFVSLAQTVITAMAEQIAAFDAKLTHYETLTTEEIMRLQERIDGLTTQRDNMLEKAYILPDGRRVFKTEDGLRVFDEHGSEVNHDLVDPDLIESSRPSWERFSATNNMIDKTKQQLAELHQFQTKLDDTRERFDQNEITAEELKTLEKELEQSVPLSLRARDTALNLEDQPAKITAEFTAATNVVNKVDIGKLELGAPGITG